MSYSTMLRLTGRIAEAQEESEIARALAFGLMDEAFAFTAAHVAIGSVAECAAGIRAEDAAALRTTITGHSVAWGTVEVQRHNGAVFTDTDRELLAAACAHAGVAIERA